jgi:cytochrome c peroxidase
MVPLHIQLSSSTLRKVIKRLHYPLEFMLVCVRWYLLCGTALAADVGPSLSRDEPITAIPLVANVDPTRAALGAKLFGDTRLSSRKTASCASCHPLDRGGADGLARAPSASRSGLLRNTPTVFNVRFNIALNWDGSVRSLEEQADGVIRSPAQFDNTWPLVLQRLGADAAYASAFKSGYADGLTRANVLDALASYERTLITPNSRFDKFLRGDQTSLSASELEGYGLFKSFGCVACHQGMNVGGNLYQKFGIFLDTKPGRRPNEEPDLGRLWVTHNERDREVFRVPSLRNVELTAPYFHDGRAATLEEAVRTMAQVQLDRSLSPHEVDAIAAFLRTLTGEWNGRPLKAAPQSPTAVHAPASTAKQGESVKP